MGAEDLLHGLAVADILLVENRGDTRDLLNLIHNVRLRIGQIVHDDDLISRLQKLDAGVAADKAGAAGNQNFHQKILLLIYMLARKRSKARLPCSVLLNTPASSRTRVNTAPTS